MKPSKYNLIFPYQFNRDYSVVYNTYRDTVGIVTAREAEFIRTCGRDLGIHDVKMGDFQRKGFIVDSNINELAVLKVEYLKAKFNSRRLTLVLVPTYYCNLDCVYCYEKLSYSAADNTVMSRQVQDSIYRWLSKNLHGVETLEVFWHGGEPLIALDAVRRLGGMLKGLAENRKVEFISGMSTNGYLLTASVAKELKELGITRYKMSVDGCRENHDCRKRHKDGSGTYDVILGNIEESIDFMDEIDLRVNIDKKDLRDAYELTKILEEKGLSEKVIPRLGKPQEYASTENEDTFTKEEYSCEAVRYSLLQGVGPKKFLVSDCFCLADRLNSVIIDGHGTVFKCVSDTGDGQSCGKLQEDGTLEYNKNFYAHGVYNPLEDDPCEKCPYLPLCFGGCTFDRKEGNSCVFSSLKEQCWSQYINAYVVKRLLDRLNVKGFSLEGENRINLEDLIMGRYGDQYIRFIHQAQSTYSLGDLYALAEKHQITLNEEDAKLLLQLIQPTELA